MAVETFSPVDGSATYKGQIGVIARDQNSIFYPSDRGAVGDSGTDNLTSIQGDIDDAATAGGGNVHLAMDPSGGDYHISAGIIVEPNVRLTMDPGVTLTLTNTTVGTSLFAVLLKPGGQILGGKIHCNNNTYTGSLLKLDGGSTEGGPFTREHQTIVDRVMLEGTAHATKTSVGLCRGLHIYAGGDGEYVEWCQFNNMTFSMLQMGIRMETENGTGGSPCFVNGNQFNNIQMDNCEYGIFTKSPDSNNNVAGNVFNNLQFETVSDTFRLMLIEGDRNRFTNVTLWDWPTSAQTIAIDWETGKAFDNYIEISATDFAADMFTGDVQDNAYSFPARMAGSIRPWTVADLSSFAPANYKGAIVYVDNGDAGTPCLAVSNGSTWKKVVLGIGISAT